MKELINGFVDLQQDELYDIDGGVHPLVVGAIVVVSICAVVFGSSVTVSAYNTYCEMEAADGA